jgi:aromatic ring-cleaving dioxygenase
MKKFVKMCLPSLAKIGNWIYYEDPHTGQTWEIRIRGKKNNVEFEHAVGRVWVGEELFLNKIVRIARTIANGHTVISMT